MALSVVTFIKVSAAQCDGKILTSGKNYNWGRKKDPHFERFLLVGSVLLMYLTVKLNVFFGKFDSAEDQMKLNFDKECDVAEVKKEA